MSDEYTLYINKPKTVMVRIWASGNVEVMTRLSRQDVWDPPIYVDEDTTQLAAHASARGHAVEERTGRSVC